MKLHRIELRNFRQYHGNHKMEFARDEFRNVTVINGVNGAGKTSFFLALNWCLYGRLAITNMVGDLVNKRAMAEASVGDRVEMSVRLWFHHSGTNYVAQRSQVFSKHGATNWVCEDKETFKLYRIRSSQALDEITYATGKIEEILSSAVRTYFFFDGEQIERFTAPGHEKDVEQAVRGVLRIEVLKRAMDHLDSVARDLLKQVRDEATGKLVELQALDQTARSNKERTELRLQTILTELKHSQQLIREYDLRLVEIERVKSFVEQRKAAELRQGEKEDEKDEVEAQIAKLASSGYIALAAGVCSESLDVIEERRQRGQIPSGIREQFLKDLLTRMSCICNRPLDVGTPAYKHVVALLEQAIPAKLEDILLQSAVDLKAVVRRASEIPTELRDGLERVKNLERELERVSGIIDEVTRHIGGSVEDAANLEHKRQLARDKQQDLLVEQGAVQEQLSGLEVQLAQLKKDITAQEAQNDETERLRRKYTLARDAADAITGIFESFAAEMRETIQREAQSIFQRLIWKQSQFHQITLSDDYRLEVLDRWGLPARPELSAGERQVLSLAFITGMGKVSGEEAPLVMDTPFGRLSSAHRENITVALPDLTSQLVLLVQDQELLGNARKALEPRIGAEYELVFDESSGSTSIRPITVA